MRCAGRGRSRTLPAFPLLLLFLLLHSKKKIKSGDCLMRERVTVSGEIVVSRQTYKPRERRLCIYAYCSLSHSHGLLRGVYFYFFFSLFDHVSQCFSCLTNITRFSFFKKNFSHCHKWCFEKKNGTKRKTKIRKKTTLVLVEENILTVKKSRPHFIALILIVSEDATTSQVASTCLQNEYDCIVLFYFLSFGAKGGKVGYSSEVPDVCVCVCVNCGGFV